MSNYFFRGASLRDMIQNGTSTLTVPEYNLNIFQSIYCTIRLYLNAFIKKFL